MTTSSRLLVSLVSVVALAILGGVTVPPAVASSAAGSSISDSIAASVGALSNSFRQSSNSSARATDVAEGDYRIVVVAVAPDRPDSMRLTLHALAGQAPDDEYFLYLPQQAIDRGQLQAGQVVTASHRPYGVQFAAATTGQAFYLLFKDEWYRDLPSNPVAL